MNKKFNSKTFFIAVRSMSNVIVKYGDSGIGVKGVSPYDIIKKYRQIKGYSESLTKKQLRNWAINYANGKITLPKNEIKPITRIVPIDRIKKINKSVLDNYAEEMRINPTPSENLFKHWLDKIIPNKFEWQKVFRGGSVKRIVDFYSKEANLVIEIDGGYHNTLEQKIKDKKREDELKDVFGVRFLRFSNEDIKRNPEDCACDAVEEIIYLISLKRGWIRREINL